MKCRICGNETGNRTFKVREMMFGLREEFIYLQCANCRCLQIEEIPENMSKYYPSDYYSYNRPRKHKNLAKRVVIRQRDYYALFNRGFIGRLTYRKFPNTQLRSLSRVNLLSKDLRILDVGCGDGYLLCLLKDFGFKYLVGIDPYLKKEVDYGNHMKILKKSIHEISGKYDLIIFHHSF